MEKMEIKFFMVLIISIIIISNLIFSGCITSDVNNKNQEYFEILYYFEIELINKSDYFVYLPLPIIAPSTTNNISKIINLRSFEKGLGNTTIENTIFGPVLNLSSSVSIILKAEKEFNRYNSAIENIEYTFAKLSTSQTNHSAIGFEDIFFHFKGLENNLITIKFHCYTIRKDEKHILDKDEWKLELNEVKDGWNSYPINIS